MAFIARLDKPCTHCNVVIAKGTSGGFTWDRSKGGFIHLDCLKARKTGVTPVTGATYKDDSYVCDTCGMSTINVYDMQEHRKQCEPKPADACTCGTSDDVHYSSCPKYLDPKPELVPAIPGATSKADGYHCDTCAAFSPDAGQMTLHIQHEHTAKPAAKKERVSIGVSNGAADELARLIQSLAGARGIDEAAVRRIAADEASKVSHTRSISVTVGEASPVKFDLAHEDLPTVIRLASMRDDGGHRPNVYLYGPAGSGKSTAARQVSKALFPDATDKYGYISLNPQTPESRLIGYMHAGGGYVATEFFKKFTTGGVFCIDEIDNAAASLLATLNGLLANGHGAFPHGVFERHADFVCIATGNTIGLGGDVNYPERRPLDGATRDRFYFMAWGYDMELISAVLTGILGNGAAEFMQWVKRETQELQARYPTHIVSPRAYIQGASLEKIGGYTRNQIRDMVIARGLK